MVNANNRWALAPLVYDTIDALLKRLQDVDDRRRAKARLEQQLVELRRQVQLVRSLVHARAVELIKADRL